MEKKRCKEYLVKVKKHARVWSQVEIRAKGETSDWREIKVKKASVEDIKPGDIKTLKGYVDVTYNGYGAKCEFVVMDDEAFKQAEIQRWSEYVKSDLEKGQIYRKGLTRLHELGCHDLDDDVKALKRKLLEADRKAKIDRWWNYFLSHAENGDFYYRAVDELHDLGCNEHDEEIEDMKGKIREIAKEKERMGEITVSLALAAPKGFRGRPNKGDLIMHCGVPYKVASSYYHDCDGMSFGAMCDEWYEVKAYNISSTEKGKEMIEEEKRYFDHKKAMAEKAQALTAIRKYIMEYGKIYAGEKLSLKDLEDQGEVVLDTMNIYGGGEELIIINDEVWFIENRGADGDYWGANTVSTGGAGAIAWVAPEKDLRKAIESFTDCCQRCDSFSSCL